MRASESLKKSLADFFSFYNPNFIAVTLCLCVFTAWMTVLVFKFSHFGYYDWDLAIYANAMWALTHGSFSGSLWGVNFLTNHAEYISLALIPIYWLFQSALTLVTFQLLSLVVGGFVFYLIAKEKLGSPASLLLMLLYFAFPANFFMLIFEFHFEGLAIVFLFLVYYYLRTWPHYGKFVLCCLLASFCKENIPPVIFMFGFMNLFQKNVSLRKFAWTAMGIGAGIFILEMMIITPLIRHTEGMDSLVNPYLGLYWRGQERISMVDTISNNLHIFRGLILNPVTASYLKDLFYPLLFFPLLGFNTLLIGLPLFLQAMLSSTKSMHTIYYHYAATLTPLLFLATLEFYARIKNRFSKGAVIFLILLTWGSLALNWKYHWPKFAEKISYWDDRMDPTRRILINQIPPDAGVISTFDFLSHLANRQNVYSFKNIWQGHNIFTNAPFIPPQAPYALIDWDCPWLWGDLLDAKEEQKRKYLMRLNEFYFSRPWQSGETIEEISLLSTVKPHDAESPLIENSNTPFSEDHLNEINMTIGNRIKLLYFSAGRKMPGNRILPLEFVWQSIIPTKDFLAVKISILKNGKMIILRQHPIGYTFNANPLWEKGQFVRERYNLKLPTLTRGEYVINLSFYNLSQDRPEPIDFKGQKMDSLNFLNFTIR